ncbi:hypothetical protein V5O48_003069 [Marasmius crinis-equi]|uniref:DNA-directed DNA polymerase X domain-containing protein n=1 Tax=Marasmius crinis-equi TaxID=585013 RepID=A0ABR3FTW1_9AGAR
MPKRSISASQESSSSSSPEPARKRRRSISESSDHEIPINVFIVDAKLDPGEMAELVSQVEDSKFTELKLCGNVQDSDIIVTAVRMRKRLERHIDWKVAHQKSIVTVEWLRDSVAQRKLLPCVNYAALEELVKATAAHCPENICLTEEDCNHTDKRSDTPKFLLEPCPDGPESSKDPHPGLFQRYACIRHSPLVCANQDLVNQFSVLRRHRELEGWQVRALSYERTIAALKAYPHVITEDRLEEVARMPFIGEKTLFKIKEYLRTGHISEASTRSIDRLFKLHTEYLSETISADERYQSLCAFNTIYGIGPSTARNLYSMNLRTLEDLDRYHDVNPDPDLSTADKLAALPSVAHDTKLNLPQLTIPVGLVLRSDFSEKIPRDEVEEMRDVVMEELKALKSGCVSTITGGYRRGKPESNDVDIVISHGDLKSGGEQIKGLCKKLVKRLYEKGLVTHVMHLSSFREHNALRTSHWDSLEKSLTAFILPDNGKRTRRLHRRLDLIFAAPEVYWTAIVGWTGSKMFERDLRLYAKEEK